MSVSRRLLVIMLLLAMVRPQAASARFAQDADASGFEARLKTLVTGKFPLLSPEQQAALAHGVTEQIRLHAIAFDGPMLDSFLEEYRLVPPMYKLIPDRPRTPGEAAYELALTRKKVAVFVQKYTMTAEDRRQVIEQLRTLGAFATGRLCRWFGALDDPAFGAPGGFSPLGDLVAYQKRALVELTFSQLQYTFCRPLTPDELAGVEAVWQQTVERALNQAEFDKKVASWRATMRTSGSPAQRAALHGDIMFATWPGRLCIAGMVKTLMEAPPTDEEIRALAMIKTERGER